MIVLFLPGGPYRGRMPKAFRKQRSTGDLPVTTYAGTERSPNLFPNVFDRELVDRTGVECQRHFANNAQPVTFPSRRMPGRDALPNSSPMCSTENWWTVPGSNR